MNRFVAAGVGLVLVVQLFAFVLLDGHSVLWISGIATALALLGIRWMFWYHTGPEPDGRAADDPAEALRRWAARTETLISWSEASRADWDRRLRPVLARQFETATGQQKAKDPNTFRATGRMLFGDELWQWVDPENISRTGAREPGPGRAILNDILQRLEHV